jgi:hypothetical protein
MRNNKLAIVGLSVILFAASCAKEGPAGPTGPAGPSYVGNINGHVSLYDQYGSKVLIGLDSVRLAITGATIYVHPDSTGYYNYTYVATGEYYITASDSGYGATNTNNFQFLSGTFNKDIGLSAIPTFSLSVTTSAGGGYDTVNVNCAADPNIRSVIVFVGSTPLVNNAPASFLLDYVKNIPANATKVPFYISAQQLYDAGFVSGKPVYFAVYSHSMNDQSAYEDQTTGKTIYNAVNYPQIDSAIVP